MAFKQSNRSLNELSEKHRHFAELMAECIYTRAECMRRAGFTAATAERSAFIGKTRETSFYPCLWDYYAELKKQRLRLYDLNAETIRNELRTIGFAQLTDFLRIPTRRDLKRKQTFDAKIRQKYGYLDAEDQQLIDEEDKDPIDAKLSPEELSSEELYKFAPGATIRLKCLEDIPEELLPAIASIEETRDGIKLKLHNKLDALDKLARILRMYEEPDASDKPTVIENLNVIVNGSQSNLLKDMIQQPITDKPTP